MITSRCAVRPKWVCELGEEGQRGWEMLAESVREGVNKTRIAKLEQEFVEIFGEDLKEDGGEQDPDEEYGHRKMR